MSRSTVAMVLGMSSSNPLGVDVRADRQGAFFVGGFHDAVEALGGVGGYRQEANVVDAMLEADLGRESPNCRRCSRG